ncbi:serine hydrolase-like protein [Battus philenor]|uniref:serine hydrolase-like protein n=1 Tax=Battus philenor TaxID=42288 RepID=UPI0035D0DE27
MKSLEQTEKAVTIRAPWGKLAALTWGDPKSPPVLLCHGRMSSCTTFRPLVKLLPDSFFYVALDLPGNGWSDPLPLGVRFTVLDLVPSVLRVIEHYQWNKFIYIGHSLGVAIGKYFNLAYPGRVTKMVELDPVPAYFSDSGLDLADWYKAYYGNYYEEEKYRKHNAGADTAPVYTIQEIEQLVKDAQGLNDEAMKHQLERMIEPAGDGLFRFTYDQRMKNVTLLPFPVTFLQKYYTSTDIPTLAVLSEDVVNFGMYRDVKFLMDPDAWPHKNFAYKIVPGGHDAYLNNPECMASDISKLLQDERKAKL